MKRIQLSTLGMLSVICLLSYSCEDSSENVSGENKPVTADSTEALEDYVTEEQINIIDTLSFVLTEEDKKSIDDFKKTIEPAEYYQYDENKLEKLEDLYKFYKGQEEYWWARTAWAEKSKLSSVDRLIEEISINPNTTPEQLKELNKYSQKLKTLFLSRDEIVDENKIPYDDMTTALLDTIINLGASIPNMNNYQSFKIMVEDIDSLHNKAQLALRRTHIASIDSLNSFTSKNRTELTKAGLDADSLTGWAY